MFLGCSEDGESTEQVFPASLVLSSQIPGYNGSKVDTKEKVEVTFPINVSGLTPTWNNGFGRSSCWSLSLIDVVLLYTNWCSIIVIIPL